MIVKEDLIQIGKIIYYHRDDSRSLEEQLYLFKKGIKEKYGENPEENQEFLECIEDILNVKYLKVKIISSWLNGEITWNQMVQIEKE